MAEQTLINCRENSCKNIIVYVFAAAGMADGQDREWPSPSLETFLVLPLSVALASFSPESVGSVEQALLQVRICC